MIKQIQKRARNQRHLIETLVVSFGNNMQYDPI